MISLSPGACLREAASAKAGERVGVRGNIPGPPLPQSSPIKGEDNTWQFSWFEDDEPVMKE